MSPVPNLEICSYVNGCNSRPLYCYLCVRDRSMRLDSRPPCSHTREPKTYCISHAYQAAKRMHDEREAEHERRFGKPDR
jgi:hypothetical protein